MARLNLENMIPPRLAKIAPNHDPDDEIKCALVSVLQQTAVLARIRGVTVDVVNHAVDGGSFEQFVETRGPALRRFAYVLSGSPTLAEDLLQTALLKSLRHWGNEGLPEAYVRRVLVNEFISWRRRSLRESAVISGELHLSDGAEVRAERDVVWRALAELPKRQRAVLVLRYYEGLSDSEIAETLGCAAGTVRSLASRAFQVLRRSPNLTEIDTVQDGDTRGDAWRS